jgi:dolichol-phosphate mannosyltransferase
MKLSVIIPAQNEAASIQSTVKEIVAALERDDVPYEVIVIDDGSSDGTAAAVEQLQEANPHVRCYASRSPRGFGFAVREGLDRFQGDVVAIVMADGSDDPSDLVRYYRLLEEGYDCAFGSRFIRGSRVEDYPRLKLALNRVANFGIRVLFRHGYNDTTNAFKAYRREVIENCKPLLSNHFNLTVELPLKAIVRGHTFGVIPIAWRNRTSGTSKLKIQEMGSRYAFIVLYAFLERHLSRGDYLRPELRDGGREDATVGSAGRRLE